MWPNPLEIADLVTFTEEILNGKLNFLCSLTFPLPYKNTHEHKYTIIVDGQSKITQVGMSFEIFMFWWDTYVKKDGHLIITAYVSHIVK